MTIIHAFKRRVICLNLPDKSDSLCSVLETALQLGSTEMCAVSQGQAAYASTHRLSKYGTHDKSMNFTVLFFRIHISCTLHMEAIPLRTARSRYRGLRARPSLNLRRALKTTRTTYEQCLVTLLTIRMHSLRSLAAGKGCSMPPQALLSPAF